MVQRLCLHTFLPGSGCWGGRCCRGGFKHGDGALYMLFQQYLGAGCVPLQCGFHQGGVVFDGHGVAGAAPRRALVQHTVVTPHLVADLGMEPLQPLGAAGTDQGGVEGVVPVFPCVQQGIAAFVCQQLAACQAVMCGDDGGFPVVTAVADGFQQCGQLNSQARLL